MASARQNLSKFDPTEHPGNVYDAFVEYVEAYEYEYAAIAKPPPAGTADEGAWTAQNKRKQFLGRFASRALQKDLEDETTAEERAALTFASMVDKLKARYKPTQNWTLANYEFHKLQQGSTEMFDGWVKFKFKSCILKKYIHTFLGDAPCSLGLVKANITKKNTNTTIKKFLTIYI